MGAGWQDGDGLVVTEADGTPVHPQVLSRRFGAVEAGRAARDPAPRHPAQLRHGGAGGRGPVKVLSQRLGHADVDGDAADLRTRPAGRRRGGGRAGRGVLGARRDSVTTS